MKKIDGKNGFGFYFLKAHFTEFMQELLQTGFSISSEHQAKIDRWWDLLQENREHEHPLKKLTERVNLLVLFTILILLHPKKFKDKVTQFLRLFTITDRFSRSHFTQACNTAVRAIDVIWRTKIEETEGLSKLWQESEKFLQEYEGQFFKETEEETTLANIVSQAVKSSRILMIFSHWSSDAEELWKEIKKVRRVMSVAQMIPKCSIPAGRKVKVEKYRPTDRAPIYYILKNFDEFLAKSRIIQKNYRSVPLYKVNVIRELKNQFDYMDVDKSRTLSIKEFCSGYVKEQETVKRIFKNATRDRDEQLTFQAFLEVIYPGTTDEEKEQFVAVTSSVQNPSKMELLDLAAIFRMLNKDMSGKVMMSDISAILVRCEELYKMAARWGRFRRSRQDFLVTFDVLLHMLFPKLTSAEITEFGKFAFSSPSYDLTEEQEEDVRDLFSTYDKNCDGFISYEEIKNACVKPPFDLDEETVLSIFRIMKFGKAVAMSSPRDDDSVSADISKIDSSGIVSPEDIKLMLITYDEFRDFFRTAWCLCEDRMLNFQKIYEAAHKKTCKDTKWN